MILNWRLLTRAFGRKKKMALDDSSFRDIATQGVIAGALGMVGRLMAIAVEKDRPTTFKGVLRRLVWEIPLAVGLGVVGKGAAEILGMSGFAHYALIIVVAYSGTQIVDLMVRKALESETLKKIVAVVKKKD